MHPLLNRLVLQWLHTMPTTAEMGTRSFSSQDEMETLLPILQQPIISSCPALQAHAPLPRIVKPVHFAPYLVAVIFAGQRPTVRTVLTGHRCSAAAAKHAEQSPDGSGRAQGGAMGSIC